jgi:protein SCO1/2
LNSLRIRTGRRERERLPGATRKRNDGERGILAANPATSNGNGARHRETMTQENPEAAQPPGELRAPPKGRWMLRFYLLLGGLVIAYGLRIAAHALFPGDLPPTAYPGIGGDFTLQGAQGPVSSAKLRGDIVVVFFGYLHCPDACPATLANIAAAFRLLHNMGQLDHVQAIFVTLDPERDTPGLAASYARQFHPRITGVGGDAAQVAAAAAAFKVDYSKHAEAGAGGGANGRSEYSIDHSTYIYVVRPDGRVGAVMSHSSTPKDIVEAIQPFLPWAGRAPG